jgi:ATP-dependent Clp protease ATP-binding subunit ClpA
MAPVAYSRVMDLNWNVLISDSKTKGEFENNLLRCLNEAVYAGNIILIIQNLPAFITSAESIGSEVYSLMGPYLQEAVQIVATADSAAYHHKIETNPTLVESFEKVLVNEPDEAKILEIVENYLREIEHRHKIFFTYQAVTETIRSANNYITSGIMPSKAINLILEISANAVHRGQRVVGKDEVLNFIRTKTNIPVGDIQGEEKLSPLSVTP